MNDSRDLRRAAARTLLAFAALLAVGCSDSSPLDGATMNSCAVNPQLCPPPTGGGSNPGSGGTGDGPTTGAPTTDGTGGPSACDGCSAEQVCVADACVDVPTMCPCPLETYCDLASGTCVIGCTRDEECDEGRICDPVERACMVGCREDTDCGAGEICEGLMCVVGCREDSDCGAMEICDGTTCRIGCNTTADCPGGQICDDTVCRDGCTGDADCTDPGEICDDADKVCRAGCRDHADCPLEKICDTTPGAFVCEAGCDTIDKCGAGKLCKNSQCVPGCLDHAWCPAGQICKNEVCTPGCLDDSACGPGEICDPDVCVPGCKDNSGCALEQVCHDKQCVEGCGPPGGAAIEQDSSRCPAGKACVPYNCENNQSCDFFECNVYCSGWECASSQEETYQCYGIQTKFCMLECNTDADCPGGKICALHADPPSSAFWDPVRFCRDPCPSNLACSNMWWETNTIQQCTCQMQGTFTGKCTYNWNNKDYECAYKSGQQP